MNYRWILFILVCLSVLVAACSSQSENSGESSDKAMLSTEEYATEDSESSGVGTNDTKSVESNEENTSTQESDVGQADRKIIYTANLNIEVKNFQKALNDIQKQVTERGGYIVESNMYEDEEGSTGGQITARIPQDKFREFIKLVEEGSSKVLDSSIAGQDVTEEYIDLESRLKSKRVVEDRLLAFMEKAEKTEDLLKISEDLAKVQEEIEQITGRMNYLQNKTDLATVTIHMQENNVTISGINGDELNTWEKIKQQFMKSINFIISAVSGLLVFLIGNLPVILIIGVIGVAVFLIVRKSSRNSHKE